MCEDEDDDDDNDDEDLNGKSRKSKAKDHKTENPDVSYTIRTRHKAKLAMLIIPLKIRQEMLRVAFK